MTVIDRETGEIIEPLTDGDARRLTERIRLTLTSMLDQRDKVLSLIREARDRQAYTALGYPSWTAYVADEFADALPRLDRAERTMLAIEFADAGMSNRSIGSVLGVDEGTVRSDLRRAEYSARPPVTDTLGRTQPATRASTSPTPTPGDVDPTPAPSSLGEVDGGAGQTSQGEEPPSRTDVEDSTGGPATPPVDPRSAKHTRATDAKVIENLIDALRPLTHTVAPNIAALDASVTSEEAARLMGGLSKARTQLSRVINLLKERTA